ncbi:MAG: hypothetical protein F4Z07_07385, partial [Dehalococcoidia bacterium]|nr:hypothetical protein [Dehalococcoidia bacterium]
MAPQCRTSRAVLPAPQSRYHPALLPDRRHPVVRQEILDRQEALHDTPILDRLADIREALVQAGDEAQELRHMPAWAVTEMVNAGIYRMVVPAELGGEDLLARQQIEVIEAASAIDGSVGWCVQINSEINALVLRQMDPKFAHEVCDDWEYLVCSGLGTPNGPFPGREAQREGDGWRVTYQGAFASGCHSATWNLILTGETIDPTTEEPVDAAFMIPKGEFEIVDTWDMAGLRGSGSHDVRIEGYVPPGH